MTPDAPKPNHLIQEKSPYLLQHATNPVEWYPWCEAAFEKARLEDKPILLSIGYSTCHWCHVMEHESFSDPRIAGVMNRYFVNIKVDREERPDVDQVYMTAVTALTGSGGWPLNVFMTPDRRPFFGGTYFPPAPRPGLPSWPDLVRLIGEAWADPGKRERLLASAEEVTGAVRLHLASTPVPAELDPSVFAAARRAYAAAYDPKWGGFHGAPKFPSPSILNFLLADWAAAAHAGTVSLETDQARTMAVETLRAMARGGIHDHLGGGFHRYATDARWHVPHFEKMLYDNAQLIVNYVTACRLTEDPWFATVARETADYVLRDMTHPDGGFYSAEDADSLPRPDAAHKKEGAFYVWDLEQIRSVLGESPADVFAYRYGVEPGGNVKADPHGEFIGTNILYLARTLEETAGRFGLKPDEVERRLGEARRLLFSVRNLRPRPHLDDKVLSSWNGLMISALARLYQTVGDEAYRTAAQRAARFVRDRLYDRAERRLYRRWRDGDRQVDGLADDYAFVIQGLLDIYEADFDPEWLDWAAALTDIQMEAFADGAGGFFMTRKEHDANLIVRSRVDSDNVLPSAASVTALNLLRMARFVENKGYGEAAERALKASISGIRKHPTSGPQMLVAMGFHMAEAVQVLVAGPGDAPQTQSLLRAARSADVPGMTVVFVGDDRIRKRLAKHRPFIENVRTLDGKPAAYVCIGTVCKASVSDPAALKALLAPAPRQR